MKLIFRIITFFVILETQEGGYQTYKNKWRREKKFILNKLVNV